MPKFKKNTSPLKYGKKSSGFKMKNPIKFTGHMGAVMGTPSSATNSTMGMPNQNTGGYPPGLKSRVNSGTTKRYQKLTTEIYKNKNTMSDVFNTMSGILLCKYH